MLDLYIVKHSSLFSNFLIFVLTGIDFGLQYNTGIFFFLKVQPIVSVLLIESFPTAINASFDILNFYIQLDLFLKFLFYFKCGF